MLIIIERDLREKYNKMKIVSGGEIRRRGRNPGCFLRFFVCLFLFFLFVFLSVVMNMMLQIGKSGKKVGSGEDLDSVLSCLNR